MISAPLTLTPCRLSPASLMPSLPDMAGSSRSIWRAHRSEPGPLVAQRRFEAEPVEWLRRGPHHRAHLPLAAPPCHQGAQHRLRVDAVRFGPATAAVHRNRGRIADKASHPGAFSRRWISEPVATGSLHDDDRHRATTPRLSPCPQAIQQRKQARTVAGRNAVLAGLVLARCAGHDDPARQAELQRHKQRDVQCAALSEAAQGSCDAVAGMAAERSPR